ncbi:MAG: hypothetical protein IPK66_17375 [Rhodospirillales bacterium]|nr:hypothetical protein [Rhodospirillales bacterium]
MSIAVITYFTGQNMPYADRLNLIQEIERSRGSHVISYLTSIRPNVSAQMSEDAIRVFFDHLLLLPTKPVDNLDIFLCSNGGAGTVPWRLVSLFREYAKKFSVLIPYRAYSAATLLALGADEIVMHPFAEMGPIDPTVSNEFNPMEQGTGRRLGISVEDVKAYVSFIKSTVGITHEDELVKTIEILANKVHPLALGNVERFISQTRLIARKILRTHMREERDEHSIDEIIENMASKLYFHGHPINRAEAKNELKLKVTTELPAGLESAMWNLYKDYEAELQNHIPYNCVGELMAKAIDPNTDVIDPQTIKMAQIKHTMPIVFIESGRLSSKFLHEQRFAYMGNGPNGEPVIRQDIISQRWDHSSSP